MTALKHLSKLEDAELMARTMWGEARNQKAIGMIAVAAVIQNRLLDGRFGKSLKGVMLKRWAFSCFNHNDPNLAKLVEGPTGKAMDLCRCLATAQLWGGLIGDPTGKATHYFNPGVCDPLESGAWRPELMEYCCTIKSHVFYRELRKPKKYVDFINPER